MGDGEGDSCAGGATGVGDGVMAAFCGAGAGCTIGAYAVGEGEGPVLRQAPSRPARPSKHDDQQDTPPQDAPVVWLDEAHFRPPRRFVATLYTQQPRRAPAADALLLWHGPGDVQPACAEAFLRFTWAVRAPYPCGRDDLAIETITPMGNGRTEVIRSGASGSASTWTILSSGGAKKQTAI